MELEQILSLESDGARGFVGSGPKYPWGGLYGGQIVGQGLVAASRTLPAELTVHSLRAYFIRRGDHAREVHYDVDEIRDGRSFATRRVVARQGDAVLLNMEASFQGAEESVELDAVHPFSQGGPPTQVTQQSWSQAFDRHMIAPPTQGDASDLANPRGHGSLAAGWLRSHAALPTDPNIHAAALAFCSDDLPTDAVLRAHPSVRPGDEEVDSGLFTASLDHAMWFHRPVQADHWNLHEFACRTFTQARGLAEGRVYNDKREHVATVMQEVLLRPI